MRSKSRTNLGFGMACLLILCIGIISLVSIKNYISISEHVVHNLNVQTELERLSSDFISAKASVRGFHITGQGTFLSEYAVLRESIIKKFTNLRKLSKNKKKADKGHPEKSQGLKSATPCGRGSRCSDFTKPFVSENVCEISYF